MSSQQSGLVAGNEQNEAGGIVPRNRSRFPLSDSTFTTERFADYSPCFVMEGVSGDRITLNQPHQVRTYSLKSPLMQDILKKKDYFMVPMQALLPRNWEKFYTNPPIGDDVPQGVGTGIPNFWGRLLNIFISDKSALSTTLAGNASDADKLVALFKFLLYYEMFYSNGSLLKALRISGNAFVQINENTSVNGVSVTIASDFDRLFDTILGVIISEVDSFLLTINSTTYRVALSSALVSEIGSTVGGYPTIGIRECLELMRDNLTFTISNPSVASGWNQTVDQTLTLFTVTSGYVPTTTETVDGTTVVGVPLNLARPWAYQIICAHYYSNDHIDVIYSAELYRQYVRNLYINAINGMNPSIVSTLNVFTYNGMSYEFDEFCGRCFNVILCNSGNFTNAFRSVFQLSASSLAYVVALLSFKKSLRFMDYFTGSRSRPLAIGSESTVDTSGASVGVIDIARKFQYTRFYQAVNRSGRKFSAYMQELFGITPKPDYHNPFYLAHTSDVVGSSETENTADAQMQRANSITSILRSNAARYAFTFEPDRDCVILGISYYDLPRVYTRATERQNFYLDRFDMFNPMLQFIGDQQVYNAELGTPTPSLAPFSYQNRDMEYKQKYNFASGGFSAIGTQLSTWFFSADVLRRLFGTNIGSSFIRSFNSEFDRFYVNLTGYSLGSYFHFIVRYDDRCDATRPMAYAPGIMQ